MLRREAANWLARLQSGRDPDAETRFRRWYDAHPAHAAAFERVRRSYERAGLLQQSILPTTRPVQAQSSPHARTPRYAWAAAAALVALVPAVLLTQRGILVGRTNAAMLVTGIGEIKRVALDDGSKVTLDTATSLEVEIGRHRRRARLTQGRARFEVARGGEPFIVEAGPTTVTSEASVFDVAREENESRVAVLSGSADVRNSSSDTESVTLRGGEGATAERDRLERTQMASGGTDWTKGMLEFDAMALGPAIALANRYSEQKIVIGRDIAQLRVTGAFRAGDTAGLAKALAAAFDLSLRRTAEGNLILSRKGAVSLPNKNGG
jgi:transmembrane sensor